MATGMSTVMIQRDDRHAPRAANNIFFNAHHAPLGAFASFTLGFPGAKGGLGLELGKPADQNIFIGLETIDRPGHFQALPFYAGSEDERARYDVGGNAPATMPMPTPAPAAPAVPEPVVTAFPRDAIRREFTVAVDTWTAGDLSFAVYSPVLPIPDPATATSDELRPVLVPAVLAELSIDNRKGKHPRTAFFGYQGSDPYSAMRRLDVSTAGRLVGVAQGRRTALATFAGEATSGQGFDIAAVVAPAVPDNTVFGLGSVGALRFVTPAGKRASFCVAICFYSGGIVTAGLEASYYYTRLFADLEDVAAYTLAHAETIKDSAISASQRFAAPRLSPDQRFQLAHAIRAYYGSTELLHVAGQPLWVVNEGEYRMMNTFDLTADHLFFELEMNPWVVRNALDHFADRYSYRDQVHAPRESKLHPGGLSFTHDMGVANAFACPGHSAYELGDLDGCFSHMTHEQLVNWVCCAAVYVHEADDPAWAERRRRVFTDCLESLVNRDHPDPTQRTGIMKFDSSRTGHGAEITTYDSLDVSLGQARNNVYLAVKTWAAYVLLAPLLRRLGQTALADLAAAQARRCADTLVSKVSAGGYLPAVIDEGNDSKIIPAIEGLVFPFIGGQPQAVALAGPYGALVQVLRRHLAAVLKPGICLFPDGAWKMSSTSDNSWLSKTYLCQFVARRILGLPWEDKGAAADAAHVRWLLHPELCYWGWSDQIVAGKITGSRYYPRGVTAVLWLRE